MRRVAVEVRRILALLFIDLCIFRLCIIGLRVIEVRRILEVLDIAEPVAVRGIIAVPLEARGLVMVVFVPIEDFIFVEPIFVELIVEFILGVVVVVFDMVLVWANAGTLQRAAINKLAPATVNNFLDI